MLRKLQFQQVNLNQDKEVTLTIFFNTRNSCCCFVMCSQVQKYLFFLKNILNHHMQDMVCIEKRDMKGLKCRIIT